MSWFEASAFSSLAKTALVNAQKSIDRVLDIQEEDNDSGNTSSTNHAFAKGKAEVGGSSTSNKKSPLATTPSNDTHVNSSKKVTNPKQYVDEDSLWSSFLDSSEKKKAKTPPAKNTLRTSKNRTADEKESDFQSKAPRQGGSLVLQKTKPQRKQMSKSKSEESKVGEKDVRSKRAIESSSSTTDDEKGVEVAPKRNVPKVEKLASKQTSERTQDLKKVDGDENVGLKGEKQIGSSEVRTPEITEPHNSDQKKEHSAIQSGEGERVSLSKDGSNSDEPESIKSDSDFVVINELTQSEHSLCMYDNRESSDTHSPKHITYSSNGKRSPTDSDYSIISESRFHDMTDSIPGHGPIEVITNTDEASITCSQRTSPAYSADAESEDLDDKSSPSTDERVRSGSEGDQRCEEQTREEGVVTPTPGEEEEVPGELSLSGHTESSLTDVVPDECIGQAGEEEAQKFAEVKKVEGNTEVISEAKEEGEPEDEDHNPLQPEKLLKKLADLAEVLKAREDQIISLSEQNNQLQDLATGLKIKLDKAERKRELEAEADLSSLTAEFTERIGSMEKKLQVANKERDNLKKEVQTLKTEISEKESSDDSHRLLQEKDAQIKALTNEGEKLAKEQLQNSTIIKKLRAKEKENDSLIKSQKAQLDDALKKIEYLEGVIEAKEEVENKNKDNIRTLNAVVDKQNKELIGCRAEVEESREKIRSTQAALDSSYKEIAELHKSIAAKNSEAHEHNLSSEMNAKEEMRLALEKLQQESRREQEGLILQINDLQMSLSRAEQQFSRKEMSLRQEISDLQQGLQESEGRNQELSQSVTGATRPLLRQIENLQSTFNDQSQTWEQVERNLTERLAEAQSSLAAAVEKERNATESSMMATSKVSSLESQLALIRQEKSKLMAAVEVEKTKAQSLEEQKEREHSHFESQRQTYVKALEESQRGKDILEKKLQAEMMKVEAEKKKLLLAHEALEEKERQAEQEKRISPINLSSGASTPTRSERPSLTPTLSISSQSEILERSMSINGERLQYDSLMNGSASAVMENLQSHVKQKEGAVAQLQGEIIQLERTRASMAEEIVKLANQNEQLEEEVKVIPELKKNLRELEHRYNAVLQMYGEKAEEVNELRLDIQEIKEMYRQQIEDLVKKK